MLTVPATKSAHAREQRAAENHHSPRRWLRNDCGEHKIVSVPTFVVHLKRIQPNRHCTAISKITERTADGRARRVIDGGERCAKSEHRRTQVAQIDGGGRSKRY